MSWREVTLGEVATTIRNGLFAKRPSDSPPGTRILRISSVKRGVVNLEDSRYVEGLEPTQVAKFAVNDGDLLMTRYNGSRDLVGRSALVPPIAVQSFTRIS